MKKVKKRIIVLLKKNRKNGMKKNPNSIKRLQVSKNYCRRKKQRYKQWAKISKNYLNSFNNSKFQTKD
jgi:hypothetical protein